MTKRILADASSLIALAGPGRLHMLRKVATKVHVTRPVLEETLVEKPGAAAIRAAIESGWLIQIPGTGAIDALGPGEASIILAANKNDVLILDNRAARSEAKARGLRVTGLLGLLVHGAQTKRLTTDEAVATLDALAAGDFRMTADLYAWARRALDK